MLFTVYRRSVSAGHMHTHTHTNAHTHMCGHGWVWQIQDSPRMNAVRWGCSLHQSDRAAISTYQNAVNQDVSYPTVCTWCFSYHLWPWQEWWRPRQHLSFLNGFSSQRHVWRQQILSCFHNALQCRFSADASSFLLTFQYVLILILLLLLLLSSSSLLPLLVLALLLLTIIMNYYD